MAVSVNDDELLFARGDLRTWLEQRRRQAIEEVRSINPGEALSRPHEQIANEVLARDLVPEPQLEKEGITGEVQDQRVDVSRDPLRAVFDRSGPLYIDGTRITLRVPYSGPSEVLRFRASRYSFNPPRATIGNGCLSVSRDVPADTLERDREGVVRSLKAEIDEIDQYLEYGRSDIVASNEQMSTEVRRAAEARRKKILADRDTEAILGVPLRRDQDAAKSYRVQPVVRKRITALRPPGTQTPFIPEPAITDHDFADIIGDIVSITHTFERLAVTYADMDEERLRDQILAMLGNVYGPPSGESFTKRGKTDIYLPWDGGNPIFLAECKWWKGPKNFAGKDLPQLLDRYIVWRDTHAAIILFIRNKNVTNVITEAERIIRNHGRYLREADAIYGAPVFVIHKDGDPDREIKLALVTAAIHP